MSAESYHEPYDKLTPETRDMHRAIQSLKEELDAVDWYQQRVDATDDQELKAILAHNRDEEKEHAAMVLEWIRRRDAVFAENLRTYLFTEGSITEIEEAAENQEAPGRQAPGAAPAPETTAKTVAGEGAEPRRPEAPPSFTIGALRKR
jgi:ferritin-like protein